MMKILNDEISSGVEPSKDGSGNWYWFLKVNGEMYADGEEGTKRAASLKLILNLDEYKGKLS